MEHAESLLTNVAAVDQDCPVPDNVHNANIDSEGVTHEDSTSVILVECHLCRICGEESKELIYVFDEQGILLNLAQKIRWHLPITVLEDDTLPTSVCYLCVSRLDGCHEFANLSLDTEEKLTRFFNTASESEEVWKEIDPSLITRNERTPQPQTRRPAFPNDKLIEAMSLLRQEKERQRDRIVVHASSEEPERSKSSYETVTYNVENQGFVEEVVQVYDVTAESGDVEPEPSNQWTTDYEMKLQTELEPTENTRTIIIDTSASTSQSHCIRGGRTSEETNKHNFSHVIICDNEPPSSSEIYHSIHSNFSVLPENSSYNNPIEAADALEQNTIESKQVEQEYRFICEHCGKGFRVRRTLNDHMTAHHSTNAPHKCDKCERTFTTYAGWDLHKATHSSEEPYLCDICGKRFKHTSHLHSHKRSHLSTGRKHRKLCPHCGKGFRSQFHLGEHMNVHADRRPYACPHCPKAFHRRIQLRQHAVTHLPDKPFMCPVCGNGFNRRGNMTEHLKRHNAPVALTCGICDCRFEHARELRAHRKTHTTEDQEKAMAESNGGKLFRCDVCSKAFAKRKGLIGHLPTHSRDRGHSCEFCGKNLSSRTALAYHMRSMHTGERAYPCSYCAKSFVRAESRTVHERMHTGTKPFACSICDACFRCGSSLAQHLKAHNEVPAIECSVCGKRFQRNGALKVHMRKHTGERPFVCEHCGKGFTQKNDMLKHTRMHTADKQPRRVPLKSSESATSGTAFVLRRKLTRHQVGDGSAAPNARAGLETGIDAQVADEELMRRLVLEQNIIGF